MYYILYIILYYIFQLWFISAYWSTSCFIYTHICQHNIHLYLSYVHCLFALLSLTFICPLCLWFIVTHLICPSALWFIVILLLFVLFVYLFLHVSTMYSVHMVIPPMYSRWGCGPPCTGTSPMAPHGRAFPFGVHRVVTSAGPQSQPDTERESHTQQFLLAFIVLT